MSHVYLSPDTLVARVYVSLNTSATKPAGLTVLDHDLLPVEEADLPVVGVYLVDDKLQDRTDSMTNERVRVCTVRVEVRKTGTMLSTKTIREWVITTLLSDITLAAEFLDIDFQGFTPYGMASDQRFAGADLDFSISYAFNLPGGLYA
jgi:hypothetical protein